MMSQCQLSVLSPGLRALLFALYFLEKKAIFLEQGKSEGFDSCDRPCNFVNLFNSN